MINVNGLKRNAKNIVKKYSDAQIKVREATSNDPWGPSSTIMAEIADLTYNVVAFSEIMQMIWKRLNDHGRNWRHVYKALVVLEYLIKTGSDKVAQQCIENIFAIQTLKDFQYIEENKDHGLNIREKSKKLVALLKDSEKLQAERARAIKAKSRLAESMSSVGKYSIGSLGSSGVSGNSCYAAGSNGNFSNGNFGNGTSSNYPNFSNDSGSSSSGNGPIPDSASLAILGSDLDAARPQTATEEENQLKLALALSKEEAEKQEKTKKNDELRLKLALDVSKKTANTSSGSNSGNLLDDSFPSSSSISSTSKRVTSTTSGSSITNAPPPVSSNSTIDDLLGLTIPPVEQTISQNDPWSVGPVAQSSGATSTSATLATTTVTSTSTSLANNDDPWQTPAIPAHNSATQPTSTTPNPAPLIATTTMPSINRRPISKNPFED